MTRFLHLIPLTPKNEKFDPLSIFVSKLGLVFIFPTLVYMSVGFFVCDIQAKAKALTTKPPL